MKIIKTLSLLSIVLLIACQEKQEAELPKVDAVENLSTQEDNSTASGSDFILRAKTKSLWSHSFRYFLDSLSELNLASYPNLNVSHQDLSNFFSQCEGACDGVRAYIGMSEANNEQNLYLLLVNNQAGNDVVSDPNAGILFLSNSEPQLISSEAAFEYVSTYKSSMDTMRKFLPALQVISAYTFNYNTLMELVTVGVDENLRFDFGFHYVSPNDDTFGTNPPDPSNCVVNGTTKAGSLVINVIAGIQTESGIQHCAYADFANPCPQNCATTFNPAIAGWYAQ